MKIGIILYPTYGGSGIVATELGKALAKKGHEVHFITYSVPVRLGSYQPNIYYHEVRFTDYPLFTYPPYELALTSKIVDVVKYEKLDLLHAHYAIPHASAAYMAQQILKQHNIAIPYITTLHGTDITLVGKDPAFEPVISFSINQSDVVTTVSESLKQDTLKFFKIDKEIDVVPNFISIKEKNYTIEKDKYAPNGEKILCHASNFRKVKRVEDVIGVFNKVRKQIDSKLLLIGDGPQRTKIEGLCRELQLCKDVIMLGSVKNINEVLSIADVFLLPSEKESFGLAALEAMAEKVPVIASNTGGIPELVEHGVSGFLSNVGDINDMTSNILKIFKQQEYFNNNAFKRALNFELTQVLPLYEELYERAFMLSKK